MKDTYVVHRNRILLGVMMLDSGALWSIKASNGDKKFRSFATTQQEAVKMIEILFHMNSLPGNLYNEEL